MDKEVFIFDIDGTLTPARGKMDEEFCKIFGNNKVSGMAKKTDREDRQVWLVLQ